MKKKKQTAVRVLALILAFLMLLGVVTSAIYMANAEEEMNIVFTGEDTSFFVSQKVDYVNRTGEKLDNIIFQVYGNMFRRLSAIPFDNDAFPAGYAPAGLLFYRITVNGEDCDWAMQGTDETFLRVAVELQPGESAEIGFDYYVLTTENSAFLGAGANDWRFFSFYPVPCAYMYGEFQTVPVNAFTDFGMTDPDDYKVTITAPETYIIAAPGEAVTENGTTSITCGSARDFGFLMSLKYRERSAVSAMGTKINVYGESRLGVPRAAAYAVKALDFLESVLGPLPGGSLTIAETQCASGPLSASGIFALGSEIFSKTDELEREIVYMTAKQYFGKSAATDTAREIWLCDAVSKYAVYLYIRETKGDSAFSEALNADLRPALQMTIPGGLTPDAYTNLFNSAYEYELVVLDRGCAALNEIRKSIGFEMFTEALAAYYKSAAGKFGTLEMFVNAMNEASGRTLDYFIVDTLMNIGDYSNEILEYYD